MGNRETIAADVLGASGEVLATSCFIKGNWLCFPIEVTGVADAVRLPGFDIVWLVSPQPVMARSDTLKVVITARIGAWVAIADSGEAAP